MIIAQKSKKIKTLLFACFCFIAVSSLEAQIDEFIQHPSIERLDVSYSVNNADMVDPSISVISKSVITLKDISNVSVLHFKIFSTADQSLIYQADYPINTSPVISSGGVILFRKEATNCYIVSAVTMAIGMYEYQLSTEDSQGLVSEVYKEFK